MLTCCAGEGEKVAEVVGGPVLSGEKENQKQSTRLGNGAEASGGWCIIKIIKNLSQLCNLIKNSPALRRSLAVAMFGSFKVPSPEPTTAHIIIKAESEVFHMNY